jgi:hypothetical protein
MRTVKGPVLHNPQRLPQRPAAFPLSRQDLRRLVAEMVD